MRVVEQPRLAVTPYRGQRARVGDRYGHTDQVLPVSRAEAGLGVDHQAFTRRAQRPDVQPVEANDLARGVQHSRELLRERQRLLQGCREPVELVLVARQLLERSALL